MSLASLSSVVVSSVVASAAETGSPDWGFFPALEQEIAADPDCQDHGAKNQEKYQNPHHTLAFSVLSGTGNVSAAALVVIFVLHCINSCCCEVFWGA